MGIRLTRDIEARLQKLALRTGRTATFHARAAILDHLEDAEDLILAEKRWEILRDGGSECVSLGDLEAKLGLAN